MADQALIDDVQPPAGPQHSHRLAQRLRPPPRRPGCC
jgi:hypothetical protein